jgi:hypothetical protein
VRRASLPNRAGWWLWLVPLEHIMPPSYRYRPDLSRNQVKRRGMERDRLVTVFLITINAFKFLTQCQSAQKQPPFSPASSTHEKTTMLAIIGPVFIRRN